MLSDSLCVYQVYIGILKTHRVISHSVLSWLLKGPSFRFYNAWTSSSLGEVSSNRLESSYQSGCLEDLKHCMKVIFVPDQVPAERQYALMLVAGGDEAFNHWNTFEEQVEDPKDPDQVWDALKQNFEQSTSYWYFSDVYLADFRKEVGESTADLDLCIRDSLEIQVQEGR